MKGHEYRDRIAEFIVRNFEQRGLKVYTEVSLGRSVGGTARRVDLFLLHRQQNKACIIECKLQESTGTADQKLMYAMLERSMDGEPQVGLTVLEQLGGPGVGFQIAAEEGT